MNKRIELMIIQRIMKTFDEVRHRNANGDNLTINFESLHSLISEEYGINTKEAKKLVDRVIKGEQMEVIFPQ